MKPKGIIRQLNDNGRVVIPKPWRKDYGIEERHSSVEMIAGEDGIFIRKYQPGCIFCESIEDVEIFENKRVCRNCIEKLSR